MAALTPQRKIFVLVVLTAAGLIANTVGYPIFFGIEFLFGGVFAMLALQLLGIGPGMVAAMAISSVTILRWHHPYAIPVLTLEVVAVGWLCRRQKGMGLVLADILYWVGAGMPLVYLSYRGLIHPHSGSAVIASYEQAINGITNTLVARWIFLLLNLRSRQAVFPLRELVFNLLALFVLGPSLLFAVHFQRNFPTIPAEHLELTFLFLLAALACAEFFSRRVMVAVEGLQKISSGLSGKLGFGLDIVWPTSLIREVDQLIVNFREMASVLMQKISETRRLNLTLEARVDERTRALQESEAKHRIIFENRIYAIYIFDLTTLRIIDVNQAFTALYGYSREEVLRGMTVEAILTWSEGADQVIQEAMHEGSIFIPLRYHRRKDGSIFPVEIVGGPYIWQGQRVMYAIANDITDRRMATEALMERTAQLEDLTRNLELRIEEEIGRRRKNEQLLIQQAKLAAMGEMLGAVAHQWRQPLNTLGLCVQNIKDSYRYGELSQEYLDTTVREAMEQIGHMSRTIDDFRSFFQPDKEMVVFDTMQAVGEVLTLFAAQLRANDITFTLTCRTHDRTFVKVEEIAVCPAKTALGYENEFEHVILNLVNNAKDAICERRKRGGMATGESGRILFEFVNLGPTLAITVSDNGGGIPRPVIGRIFEPYFTTKEPAKGTGIGLYLAKIIIEDHMHGSLTVENTEQGASFVITVPAEESVTM